MPSGDLKCKFGGFSSHPGLKNWPVNKTGCNLHIVSFWIAQREACTHRDKMMMTAETSYAKVCVSSQAALRYVTTKVKACVVRVGFSDSKVEA